MSKYNNVWYCGYDDVLDFSRGMLLHLPDSSSWPPLLLTQYGTEDPGWLRCKVTCWNSEGELAEGMTDFRTLTTYQKPNLKLPSFHNVMKVLIVALIGVLEYCFKCLKTVVFFLNSKHNEGTGYAINYSTNVWNLVVLLQWPVNAL